jgi:hypothetical protein
VQRSYDKFAGGAAIAGAGTNSTGSASRVLRIIHIVASQSPRMLVETEQALLATGMPVFARAGTLVHPVVETTPAADDCKDRGCAVATLLRRLADRLDRRRSPVPTLRCKA